MKGLLLFVAGLLCGGAAVSWLFLSREPAAPVPVESALPMPADPAAGVTGLEPGADDLPLSTPSRDPHDAPGLDIDPLARTTLPPVGVPPLPGSDADDAADAANDGTAADGAGV